MYTPARWLGLLGILAAFSAAACDVKVGRDGVSVNVPHGEASDRWMRTYTLPPGARFEITNRNGRIEVEPANGPQVEVRAFRTARASTGDEARHMLETLRISETVSPAGVRIETDGDSRDRGFWSGLTHRMTVEYSIRVPAGLNLSFETRNGGIHLANVAGTIQAQARNGGIQGERLSGSLKAIVRNGGIRVDMAEITGDIDLSLRNGGIRLQIPRDARASLNAQTHNGGISIDDALPLQTTERSREHARFIPDRRRLAGALNGGGRRITAVARNGGIQIRSGPGQQS